jgi:hypothetical protein
MRCLLERIGETRKASTAFLFEVRDRGLDVKAALTAGILKRSRTLSSEEQQKNYNCLQAGLLTLARMNAPPSHEITAMALMSVSNLEPYSGGDRAGFSPASLFSSGRLFSRPQGT